jgi:hypothetical protein
VIAGMANGVALPIQEVVRLNACVQVDFTDALAGERTPTLWPYGPIRIRCCVLLALRALGLVTINAPTLPTRLRFEASSWLPSEDIGVVLVAI